MADPFLQPHGSPDGGHHEDISGGGGEPLDERPPIPGSAYFTSTYHCVSVTINGRSLTSVGVRPDGVEFDLFTLYAPPVAGSSSSSPDWLGQITVFTNSTVTSGTTTYQWTMGDGVTSTLENPTHTYALPGVYTVALTATNIAGSSVATDSVTLYGPPAANFEVFPSQGVRPLTVAFTDATTTIPLGDPTLTYLWRLGDGGSSSLPNLTHTYTMAGTYTVTLTVSNAAGSDTVTRATIQVGRQSTYLPLILSGRSEPWLGQAFYQPSLHHRRR